MKNGFYKSLSMDDYHAAEGLNKSALSDLAISPAHYKARKLEPKTFAAADLGTAVHLMVLEPEMSEAIIITPPKEVLSKSGGKNTNAFREWVSAQPDDCIILNTDEYDQAQYMRDAVIGHPRYIDLLTGGNQEVSAFWTDPQGLTRKCRPDYLNDAYAVDLKTAISAHPAQFGRQAYNLHYHWSASWTLDIIAAITGGYSREYIFVCVEKEPPYAVACYSTPQEIIDMARNEIAPIVAQYRACLETDIWPGYSDQIEPLQYPKYAFKKQED
jgi:hypothetical protein